MSNFFRESRNFAARNQQLFNFIHTSSVALWNLRWQVQGYVAARPDVSAGELSARFTSGTDIRANNLRGTCIDTPWTDQLGHFAQIVSSNLIAMYEGWAEELMPKFGDSKLAGQVQFPSRAISGRPYDGIQEALATARSNGLSDEMKRAFFPLYSASRKYNPACMDSLLILYRYHKEIRNSFMHRGGVANAIAEQAWLNASTLTRADLGMRSSPMVTKLTDGIPADVDIDQAIQLSDVLLRLVSTIDAELCFTDVAKAIFMNDMRNVPAQQRFRELPSDPDRRIRRLVTLTHSSGYVTPADVEAVYNLARQAGVVAY